MTAVPEPRALRPAEPEPGVLVHTRADRELATAHWLLAAADNRDQARMQWAEHGIALLRCGTLFSAVRIPEKIVHAAVGTDEAERVDTYLDEALRQGPVIRDPRGRHYYALTPASTATTWRHAVAVCLGRDTYLGVPRLDAVGLAPQGWASYWSVPMSSAAELCFPETVAQLVALGAFRIADEEPKA